MSGVCRAPPFPPRSNPRPVRLAPSPPRPSPPQTRLSPTTYIHQRDAVATCTPINTARHSHDSEN